MDQYAQDELAKRIENASPAQRVSMLYERAVALVSDAAAGTDAQTRRAQVTRALNIVNVLRESLNGQAGVVSAQLSQTYDTIAGFLQRAGAGDDAAARTAAGMLAELHSTWNEAMNREQR